MANIRYQHLYIISFLDYFCTGITLPVLNNYIVVGLNGSHLLLGLLGMVTILSQCVIQPFLNPITAFVGTRNFLIASHIVTFLNYFIIIIANDYHLFLLFRVPFIIFNQTQCVIEMMMSNAQHKRHIGKENNLKIFKTLALIFGPFCGGLLYHDNNILSVACMLNILTALNLVMVYKLPKDTIYSRKTQNSHALTYAPWQNNILDFWRNLSILSALKICIFVGMSCFFIKFTLILTSNMKASASLIGFTIALHNLVLLSAQFACQLVDDTTLTAPSNVRKLMVGCICLMTASMYILATTTDYGMYLITFVVLVMSQEMFERLWAIASEPTEKNLVESTLTVLTCVLLVVLGALCDLYSHSAVQMMSILPLSGATVLGVVYFKRSKLNHKMRQVEQQIMKSFDVNTLFLVYIFGQLNQLTSNTFMWWINFEQTLFFVHQLIIPYIPNWLVTRFLQQPRSVMT